MDPLELILEIKEEQIIIWLLKLASTQLQPPQNQTGKRAVILHNQMEGQKCLMKDYFVEFPVYNNQMFERRFRMSRQLF